MPGEDQKPVGPVLRNVDLDRTVTVRQVLEICSALKDDLASTLHANLEHWTDDDGLHQGSFARDAEREFGADVDRAMAIGLTEAMESER